MGPGLLKNRCHAAVIHRSHPALWAQITDMNNVFTGSCRHAGLICDYTGIWAPLGTAIQWKAIVRNADVLCRPSGTLHDASNDDDVLEAIAQLIEVSVIEVLERRAVG